MINYPKELERIRFTSSLGIVQSTDEYVGDIDILLSYIDELSKVATVNTVCSQELKSLNKLRDNLNSFIKDNVVVLTGAE